MWCQRQALEEAGSQYDLVLGGRTCLVTGGVSTHTHTPSHTWNHGQRSHGHTALDLQLVDLQLVDLLHKTCVGFLHSLRFPDSPQPPPCGGLCLRLSPEEGGRTSWGGAARLAPLLWKNLTDRIINLHPPSYGRDWITSHSAVCQLSTRHGRPLPHLHYRHSVWQPIRND